VFFPGEITTRKANAPS